MQNIFEVGGQVSGESFIGRKAEIENREQHFYRCCSLFSNTPQIQTNRKPELLLEWCLLVHRTS